MTNPTRLGEHVAILLELARINRSEQRRLNASLHEIVQLLERTFVGSVRPVTGAENPVYPVSFKNHGMDVEFVMQIQGHSLVLELPLDSPVVNRLHQKLSERRQYLYLLLFLGTNSADIEPVWNENVRVRFTSPTGNQYRLKLSYVGRGLNSHFLRFVSHGTIDFVEFIDLLLGTDLMDPYLDIAFGVSSETEDQV
jgi:hypothetical protein